MEPLYKKILTAVYIVCVPKPSELLCSLTAYIGNSLSKKYCDKTNLANTVRVRRTTLTKYIIQQILTPTYLTK